MKENQKLKTELYMDHEKLICSLAWKYARKTCFDFEELKSEFNLVFCYSFKEYNEDLGVSFTSFLCGNCVRQVYSNLTLLTRKKRKYETLAPDAPEMLSHDPLDSIILHDTFVNNSNPVIRSITSIVSTYTLPQEGFRKWLKKILHSFGHKSKDISEAFKTLHTLQDPKGEI